MKHYFSNQFSLFLCDRSRYFKWRWKNTQASVNLSIKVLNNSTGVHPCTSLNVGVYEKCPEDKSKAWNWTTFFAGNLHPETRDLITLIIISACWAELPKLLVVIKLPNCFLNSTAVFDSVTSPVNEFHRSTIHMHKALFTSICSEFTAPYFLSSISLSASYYGTRLKKKNIKVSFVILSASIKDFCKIHWILESFIRKMKNRAIFHPVSIYILFSSWLLITWLWVLHLLYLIILYLSYYFQHKNDNYEYTFLNKNIQTYNDMKILNSC